MSGGCWILSATTEEGAPGRPDSGCLGPRLGAYLIPTPSLPRRPLGIFSSSHAAWELRAPPLTWHLPRAATLAGRYPRETGIDQHLIPNA